MIKDGFDKSHPVHLWISADGTKILIDGYTRLAAAKKAGLYEIAVYEHKKIGKAKTAEKLRTAVCRLASFIVAEPVDPEGTF